MAYFGVWINNKGHVIGTTVANEAVLWQSGIGAQPLGNLGRSIPSGLNDNGQVVGIPRTPRVTDAFVWQSGTGIKDLGTLGNYSFASGIANDGRIVGASTFLTNPGVHAFFWHSGSPMQDLGTTVALRALRMEQTILAR